MAADVVAVSDIHPSAPVGGMPTINQIRKRDGRVVAFGLEKVARTAYNAMAEVGEGSQVLAQAVAAQVHEELLQARAQSDNFIPTVEHVSDLVERFLILNNVTRAAQVYISYRSDHAKALRRKLQAQATQKDLRIKKRDGRLVRLDLNQVRVALAGCFKGYVRFQSQALIDGIIEEIKTSFYDGMETAAINQAVLLVLRTRIEKDPIYNEVAARFLFNDLYKELLGLDEFTAGFVARYREVFETKIKAGVEDTRLDPRLLDFDFKALSRALDPKRDRLLKFLGAQTLTERYFLRNHEQHILEVPQYFWMRVAMGLSVNEDDKNRRAIEFYDALSKLRFVSSTPTLFHAGTTRPQLSSCYLTTVEDDLGHIFKAISDNAQLSKWSGGLGNDWTNVRGTGALIASTNVPSQGVIPFLKIADTTTAAINRSGRRRGATCAYLETWHYDIESFLELRKNTGDERRRTHDMNTANWIPDVFIQRVIADKDWTLFSPDETPDLHHLYGKAFQKRYQAYERLADQGHIRLWRRVKAKDLWRKMLTHLYETGHPWMTFKDPSNVRSPQDHVGVVHSSNLCTEITLNTSKDETAVCNLGSVNLTTHMKEGVVQKRRLARTVKTAMRMLDNVIEINFYPTIEAQAANLRHRPVGLGIMGVQDALYEQEVPFDSERAVEFSDEVMEYVAYHAILNSSKLAQEKGRYESFKGSKWDRGLLPQDTIKLLEAERGEKVEVKRGGKLNWKRVRLSIKKYGMRNSNTMAIAPTATIANIAGCFPSIEPVYSNLYVKSNQSGEFTVLNFYLVEDLQKRDLWNDVMLAKLKAYDGSIQNIAEIPERLRELYKGVFEIAPVWVVRHAARRAKWLDQSQSVNLFTRSQSGKDISDMYLDAWRMGLKTTYYLRTLGATGIEKSTIGLKAQAVNGNGNGHTHGNGQAKIKNGESLAQRGEHKNHHHGKAKSKTLDLEAKTTDKTMCILGDEDCEACQ